MSWSGLVTRSGVDVGRADAMARRPAKAVENFIVEIWAMSEGASKIKNEETKQRQTRYRHFKGHQRRVEVNFVIDSNALGSGRRLCNELADQEFVFPEHHADATHERAPKLSANDREHKTKSSFDTLIRKLEGTT